MKFKIGDIVAVKTEPYRECRVIDVDVENDSCLIRFYYPYEDKLVTKWRKADNLQSFSIP